MSTEFQNQHLDKALESLTEAKNLGAQIMNLFENKSKFSTMLSVYLVWRCMGNQEPKIERAIIEMEEVLFPEKMFDEQTQ